jgi:hypothetical protein
MDQWYQMASHGSAAHSIPLSRALYSIDLIIRYRIGFLPAYLVLEVWPHAVEGCDPFNTAHLPPGLPRQTQRRLAHLPQKA